MATSFVPNLQNWSTPSSFFAQAFDRELEYRNADERINSGDDPATPCRNLVIFGPVTPEFTRPNCVHQALISTMVSLTTFARGSTRYCGNQYSVLFRFYSLGATLLGRPAELHARL